MKCGAGLLWGCAMREAMLSATRFALLVLMVLFVPVGLSVAAVARWMRTTSDALEIELLLTRARRKAADHGQENK